MTETREIKCDACGADLTYTGNCEDYYLVLSNASKAPWYVKEGERGGVVTSMAISPAINRAHHFCDLRCLDHWRDRERHRNGLWREWWETWKAQHGSKDDAGRVRSFPSPPDEIYNPLKEKFAAAALAAFPMSKPESR